MNKDILKEWIEIIEKNGDEESFWNNQSEETRALLEPIRKLFIKQRENISDLEEKIKRVSRNLYFYKEAIRSLPNPIFIKNDQVEFCFFNKKYEDKFGMNSRNFLGKKVFDLDYLPEEDRKRYHKEDKKMIKESSVVHYEVPFLFSDGNVHDSLYWSKGFLVPETNERGLVGEIVDISKEIELRKRLECTMSKIKEANEIIEKKSRTDTLTGLGNRYVLNEEMKRIISISKRHRLPFSILLADLDNFKAVNDKYGHFVGDEVLKKFSQHLKDNSRFEDIPIRYGGEEFLVILPMTEIEEAINIGERICSALRKMPILPDKKSITVSIGVTQFLFDETLNDFLIRVDQALYIAKNCGKDKVHVL